MLITFVNLCVSDTEKCNEIHSWQIWQAVAELCDEDDLNPRVFLPPGNDLDSMIMCMRLSNNDGLQALRYYNELEESMIWYLLGIKLMNEYHEPTETEEDGE